ncbi:phosphogluconate dehydratase [Halovibrio salipaludis]|uniref:Phosphogluconate dehydratase n=2 Tax=Halovibrio salipaludis TaxID=2032626 RepID=A0A2A2F735_9GAMM|nr:phosphogluconate dehydratase [Halovibrio salipaludis]
MHPTVEAVTRRIRERSATSRDRYLALMAGARGDGPQRETMSCTNLAHVMASKPDPDKLILRQTERSANVGIISAYNEMLSAHQPYGDFPDQIRRTVARTGHVAQFAAGVPAMCDGITQGQPGMELSLFSRDLIAQATAIGLSHNVFDGVLCLGICDKIVPGLLTGALRFGHLPTLFVPAGPMPSGMSNAEKSRIREQHARGEIGRDELLEAESRSYHSPGTCTFYGTANSNQVLMEVMGLQLPGSSFVNPGTDLREAFTQAASRRITEVTDLGDDYRPLSQVVSEKTLVNAMVALLATGGSTNHSIHLVAIGRAAGIRIDWEDFHELSRVVPLLCRLYPNGESDINDFDRAGGVPFLVRELLGAGLMHEDVSVMFGESIHDYTRAASLDGAGRLVWDPPREASGDTRCLRAVDDPFVADSGFHRLEGNLGRAIIKTSSVPEDRWCIEAPARVFADQQAVMDAWYAGELTQDFVAVLPGQGPGANGMPELHKLMPVLANLQSDGLRVALLTDGRLSGASGKVPSAIHVYPEAARGGAIGRIRDGDRVLIDATAGALHWEAGRDHGQPVHWGRGNEGLGRELFSGFREQVTHAEAGATIFRWDD